jgi:hypothetical protein
MSAPSLLLDVDGVLCGYAEACLGWMHREHGHEFTIDQKVTK